MRYKFMSNFQNIENENENENENDTSLNGKITLIDTRITELVQYIRMLANKEKACY